MAAQIDYVIPEQAFEIVKERIAVILTEELAEQANLAGVAAAPIFVDRIARIDDSEVPCLNVTMERDDFDNQDVKSARGTVVYNVDIFIGAEATKTKRGDTIAHAGLDRVAGMVRYILQHSKYYTLGFAPGFVHRRQVQNIQIARPEQYTDAHNIAMGRVQLMVQMVETEGVSEGVLIKGYESSVKIAETEQGYKFTQFP